MKLRHIRRMLVLVTVALSIPLLTAWVLAAEDPVGTAIISEVGTSARVIGMGGAFIGVADDATAVYYNPAGLALLSGRQVYSMYTNRYNSVSHLAAIYGERNLGFGIVSLQANGIELTDEFGNPSGYTDYGEQCILGAAATKYRGLNIGVTVKYYRQKLTDDDTGSGITADVGVIYDLPGFRIGAVGRNVFGEVNYSTGAVDPFDRKVGLGASWKMAKDLTVAVDVWNDLRANLGAEYAAGNLALRCGARVTEEGTNFAAGFGAKVRNFQVDYSFETHPVLADNHRLSLGVKF